MSDNAVHNRIAILGDGSSIHVKTLAHELRKKGKQVIVISLSDCAKEYAIIGLGRGRRPQKKGYNYFYLRYMILLPHIVFRLRVKLILSVFSTSYGLFGFLLSIFGKKHISFSIGSDINAIAERNFIFRVLLRLEFLTAHLALFASKTLVKRAAELKLTSKGEFFCYGVPDSLFEQVVSEKKYDIVSTRQWCDNSRSALIHQNFSKLECDFEMCMVGVPFKPQKSWEVSQLKYEEVLSIVMQSHFYLSITINDGLPLSVIEAMAMGAVPIMSDNSASKELIEHGKTGFILTKNEIENLDTTLHKIMSDYLGNGEASQHLLKISRACRVRADNYRRSKAFWWC